MKKAIEETWRSRNSPACTDDIYKDTDPRDYIFYGSKSIGEPGYEEQRDRSLLAAAAPEMARMLLDIEFGWDRCKYCLKENGADGSHANDCPWLLLMKKIGAR